VRGWKKAEEATTGVNRGKHRERRTDHTETGGNLWQWGNSIQPSRRHTEWGSRSGRSGPGRRGQDVMANWGFQGERQERKHRPRQGGGETGALGTVILSSRKHIERGRTGGRSGAGRHGQDVIKRTSVGTGRGALGERRRRGREGKVRSAGNGRRGRVGIAKVNGRQERASNTEVAGQSRGAMC